MRRSQVLYWWLEGAMLRSLGANNEAKRPIEPCDHMDKERLKQPVRQPHNTGDRPRGRTEDLRLRHLQCSSGPLQREAEREAIGAGR